MWKYGLIKIEHDGLRGIDDDRCELVELYFNPDGESRSFCAARIHSVAELNSAYGDIHRDGINTWFADNGKFEWNKREEFWDWEKNE